MEYILNREEWNGRIDNYEDGKGIIYNGEFFVNITYKSDKRIIINDIIYIGDSDE